MKFEGQYKKLNERHKVSYVPFDGTLKGTITYLEDLEKWYQNRFGLKYELVEFNSSLYKLLNLSHDPDKVIIGKNGFLFAGNNYNNVIAEHTGADMFSDSDLNDYFEYLNRISDVVLKSGCKFYMVVVPNKHTIYDEYLPFYARKRTQTKIDQFFKFSQDRLNILDLRPIIFNAKTQYGDSLYRRLDSHWNSLGAYFGYLGTMNFLKKDFPVLTSLTLRNFHLKEVKTGGLTYKINLMKDMYDFIPKLNFNEKLHSLKINTTDGNYRSIPGRMLIRKEKEVIIKNENTNNLCLLIIRDSYANNLSYLFNQSFGKVIYSSFAGVNFLNIC